ncbi:hypothetical protein V5O48_014644 [Marasmius crinis-equi]|uniref:C2H2-type domain-containing protein n=1 Tax=Marasmius crinis-equi TaxID=585013 RepID=A0ABR3EWR8_9AGAR
MSLKTSSAQGNGTIATLSLSITFVMDKFIQASQIYARSLYILRRGCALFIPEPNDDLSQEYREKGAQIGDVGVLRADGKFDFIFNVCCPDSDPINQYGVPDGFIPLRWNGFRTRTDNIFPPGEPVLSGGAERQAFEVGASASLPGAPLGLGAGFSIKFAKNRGAIIWPPHGANSVDCQSKATFREYAETHSISWYRFVNETLGMEVENGSIYFITGFDKTDCWENAVVSSTSKERKCELFVATGGLASGDCRFVLSESSFHEIVTRRSSPAGNSKQNQALFIRGFRISISGKLKAFFEKSSVKITDTYSSSWRDVLGKTGGAIPFTRDCSSSSSGSRSSPHGGSEGHDSSSSSQDMRVDAELSPPTSYESDDTDISMEEDNAVPLQQKNGVNVAITHDDDWISLLNEEDLEVPDDSTLISRLEAQFEITVEKGTASLKALTNSKSPVSLKSTVALFPDMSKAQSSSKRSSPVPNYSDVPGFGPRDQHHQDGYPQAGASEYSYPWSPYWEPNTREFQQAQQTQFLGNDSWSPSLVRLRCPSPDSSTTSPSAFSYTPPSEFSYTPPSEFSYTPPSAFSYTSPSPFSYTPPMPSGRTQSTMYSGMTSFTPSPSDFDVTPYTPSQIQGDHMRSHRDARPFKCEMCSKGFRSRSDLTRHNKRKKPCEEGSVDWSFRQMPARHGFVDKGV